MSAEAYLPAGKQSIAALRAAAEHCEGCDLYEQATQTVFGEGKASDALPSCSSGSNQATSRIGQVIRLSVRPGNCSMKRWRPSGSTVVSIYVTNAVKHFKWEQRGKLRLHKKPSVEKWRTAGHGYWRKSLRSGRKYCSVSGSTAARSRPRTFIPGHEAEGRGAERARWATDRRDGAPRIDRPHPMMARSGVKPSTALSMIFAVLLASSAHSETIRRNPLADWIDSCQDATSRRSADANEEK